MFIKKIVFITILGLIISSCDKKSTDDVTGNFTIKVSVDNIADNTKILLKKQENNIAVTIDSTIAKNGSFQFKGAIEIPTIYGIFIDSVRGGIFPLIESGTINISAHKDSLFAATIIGSKLNDELNNFKEDSKKIVSKINDLFPEVQKARAENNVEKIDELNKKMQAINEENTQFVLDYAKNNVDSYISPMVLQSLLRLPTIDKNAVTSIYTNFSDKVKESDYSKNIAKYIEENTPKKDSIN